MYWLFFPLLAYFLGSLPFGLIIARLVKGIDPREHGSHNTGATNGARLCGFKWGVLALVLDILKGFAP
ncbi:MAG: glycerol-3-phosphate acyltransferase, partial [Proteobacteria bacterium]|nr:glycerol-3-phosphate acyltransferase [Pseudomonadota bacterium]